MTKKMTKKDWLNVMVSIVEVSGYENKDEAIEFLNHEINMLDRKNTSSKARKTPTQELNERIKETIKEVLCEIGKPATISELMEYSPELNEHSSQKLSALMRQLVEAKEVDKAELKRRSYFSLHEE